MKTTAQNIIKHRFFDPFIIALIIVNALILGLETSPTVVAAYGSYLELGNQLILIVFVVEALLKITAVVPRLSLYFGDGWNLFDFSVVVLSLLPFTGQYAMIARVARLLRVARLMTTIPELRMIISTLIRSIPSILHVVLLMFILFYIYAVAGYHFFSAHDPVHWENLGVSLLTLFRVLTLEDWTDVMYIAMEMNSYSWIYFVSFVTLTTFVVINLFIAILINNLEKAKLEIISSEAGQEAHHELIQELRNAQEMLMKFESHLERSRDEGKT